MRKKTKQRNKLNITIITILGIILAVYVLSMLFVLGWGLLTSFKTSYDFKYGEGLTGPSSGNVLGLPNSKYADGKLINWGNYTFLFEYEKLKEFTRVTSFYFGSKIITHNTTSNLFTMFLNSLLYAGAGAFLQAAIPALVAYLCAKFRYKFSEFIYALVVATMTIPIIGNQAAMITLLRDIGLFDTFAGYFLMKSGFGGMYFLIYYAFFVGFSDAYKEAAEIDGANNYQILLKIVIPLSAKIIGTVFIIQFVHFWNDYQTALLYMPTKPTMAFAIYYFSIEAGGPMKEVPNKTALCMLLAVPILIVFIIFKDKVMGNITIGGVKG